MTKEELQNRIVELETAITRHEASFPEQPMADDFELWSTVLTQKELKHKWPEYFKYD